jgi:antiviral helicase SLH1
MSPSADTAASQWLEQLATMRAAIAELKLPKSNGDSKDLSYENEYDLDDDDLSPASGSDDIWDIISDEDEDDFSESQDSASAYHQAGPEDAGNAKGTRGWLSDCCADVASRGSGLDADTLEEQITAVLASDSSDDELQMTLADILSFDELEQTILWTFVKSRARRAVATARS